MWICEQTVPAGATVTVEGRVKMNAKAVGKQMRMEVHVADEVFVRFCATVARPIIPRILAGVAASAGVLTGAAVGPSVGWMFGIAVILAGFIPALILAISEG